MGLNNFFQIPNFVGISCLSVQHFYAKHNKSRCNAKYLILALKIGERHKRFWMVPITGMLLVSNHYETAKSTQKGGITGKIL